MRFIDVLPGDQLLGFPGFGTERAGTGGRVNAKINLEKARSRADELSARLRLREDELKEE